MYSHIWEKNTFFVFGRLGMLYIRHHLSIYLFLNPHLPSLSLLVDLWTLFFED